MPQAVQVAANNMPIPMPNYGGGLLKTFWELLGELGHSEPERIRILEPFEWVGDHLSYQGSTSVYPALNAFDPYPASPFNNKFFPGVIYAGFNQSVIFFRRFVDLLRKIGPFITDNYVAQRVQTFISIWGHAQEAGHTTLNIADIARYNRTTGDTEFGSEEESRNFTQRYEGSEGTFGATSATVVSTAEPFDLSGLTAEEMYIDVIDQDNGAARRVELGSSATLSLMLTTGNLPDPPPAGGITITVDGVEHAIDVAALAAAGDDEAAARVLAMQIGASASHHGATVTITSPTRGPDGFVRIAGSADALAGVAFGASEVRGAWPTTAAEIREQIGAGNYDATAEDGVVTIDHRASGDDSFLSLSGPAAARIFGSDPAEDRGRGAGLRNFAAVRSLQFEIAKWPEDLRNIFRPIYQAFGDVLAVYSHFKGLVDDVLSLIGIKFGPPARVGVIAKEGVTIGTGGPLFSVANATTFVAGVHALDPDDEKHLMGLERYFAEGVQNEPLKWGEFSKKVKKLMAPDPKNGHMAEVGGFQVVSARHISLLSAHDTAFAAAGRMSVSGTNVRVTSKHATHIGSQEVITLTGKDISIGTEVPDILHKEAATESFSVRGGAVDMRTKSLAFAMKDGAVDIGTRLPMASMNLLGPRLHVDADQAQIGVMDNQGGVGLGVTVSKQGDVAINAASKLDVVTAAGGFSVQANLVNVLGILKVGSAMMVVGDGVVPPNVMVPSVPTEPIEVAADTAAILAEYAALVGQATGFQAAISSTKVAISQGAIGVPTVASEEAAKALSKTLETTLELLENKLLLVIAQHGALVQRAKNKHIKVPTTPADATLFTLR